MRKTIKEIVPQPIKKAIRRLIDLPKHGASNLKHKFDVSIGQKNPLIPPPAQIFVGNGSYEETGRDFLSILSNSAD